MKIRSRHILLIVDILVLATNFAWVLPATLRRMYIVAPLLVIAIMMHVCANGGKLALTSVDSTIIGSLLCICAIQIIHILSGSKLENGSSPLVWLMLSCTLFLWSRQTTRRGAAYVAVLKKAAIGLISVSCIMSLPLLIREYGLVRSYSTEDETLLMRLADLPYSVGSWLTYTSVIVTFPMMMVETLQCKKKLWLLLMIPVMLACLVSSLSSVLLYSIVSAIMLNYGLSLRGRKITLRFVVRNLLLLAGIVVLFAGSMAVLANISRQNVLFESSWDKLKKLFIGVFQSGTSGDFTGRFNTKLIRTMKAIQAKPLLGWGYGHPDGPAGHMHLLDVWGWYGIFGETALLVFFAAIWRLIRDMQQRSSDKTLCIGVKISLFLLFLQGIFGGILFSTMLSLMLTWVSFAGVGCDDTVSKYLQRGWKKLYGRQNA